MFSQQDETDSPEPLLEEAQEVLAELRRIRNRVVKLRLADVEDAKIVEGVFKDNTPEAAPLRKFAAARRNSDFADLKERLDEVFDRAISKVPDVSAVLVAIVIVLMLTFISCLVCI